MLRNAIAFFKKSLPRGGGWNAGAPLARRKLPLHRKDGACAPEKWDADGAASLPWGAIGAAAPGFKARNFEALGL
jgi:hypothetical protein